MALFKKSNRLFISQIALILASCNNLKYLPANDALYTGAKIKMDSSRLSHKQNKNLTSDLLSLTRPRPNSKILGLRVKLYAYNIAGHPKKQSSPFGWLKNKFGEAPVLASNVDIEYNAKVIQSYLQNKGYFQAFVYGDTVIKQKIARAVYQVQTGIQYTIQEVILEKDSSSLNKAMTIGFSETLLKRGKPFDLDVIKLERIRIDADLKEKGFYFFSPDYLIVDADSNLGNHTVKIYIHEKQGIPGNAQRIFHIKDIFIFSNYSLIGSGNDTSRQQAVKYKNYYLIDSAHIFRPGLFGEMLRFNPGDIYTRSNVNVTLSRLINLNLFKFVRNRFEVDQGADSPMLNSFYYLTPLPKRSIYAEIFGTTKSDNLAGSQVTVGWSNRNTFKAGEVLSINVYGGFEVQFSSTQNGYNTYRTGLDNKLSFPRFIIPIINLNTTGAFVPKTTIELGYDYLRKERLFTLNSFRTEFGYEWKKSARMEHQLNPIAITYVQPSNITQEYIDSAINNPTLLLAVQKQFILGSTYNFTYNQLVGKQPRNAIYFNGNLDLSGNIAGLLSGADAKDGNTKYVFGLDFAQYVRVETDFRYYHKEGNTVWANRIDVGFGYPYGNSTALPFVKQFFVGGTNSLRAFRSSSVGPGTYEPADQSNFLPDQTGDIKLELNTELRVKLFSIVNGAIFVDAGNVWLYNADTSRPGGQFNGQFLQQLAVGTGVGLRFDISILILRLDVAFPLRKPYLPEGQRWVINQIDFGSGNWRSQNLVFNLGIGYPF